jgi:hypothetical protein
MDVMFVGFLQTKLPADGKKQSSCQLLEPAAPPDQALPTGKKTPVKTGVRKNRPAD